MPARSHGRESVGEKGMGHIRYTSILSSSMSKWRMFMQLSLDGWMEGGREGGMNEWKKVWTEREGREDWCLEGCWKDEC